LEQPAAAQTGTASPAATCTAPTLSDPNLVDVPSKTVSPYWDVNVFSAGGPTSCAGKLFLEVSQDGTHWQVLGSQHTEVFPPPATTFKSASVTSACIPGTPQNTGVLYRGVFVSDDHSFKGAGPTGLPLSLSPDGCEGPRFK
jgi:hypothetical protein